jgi:hypothetical protein
MKKILFLLSASVVLLAGVAYAQDDAPSLGDVARQSRQQKQQKDKDSTSKAASDKGQQAASAKNAPSPKPAHVITNEELPSHSVASSSSPGEDEATTPDVPAAPAAPSGNRDAAASQWKSQIQSQKQAIASLQQQITSVSESIRYAGGNCVANCQQWNERQKQKQDEVESMKAQLEQQQKKLEEMQESARKQGFGSQVYDP